MNRCLAVIPLVAVLALPACGSDGGSSQPTTVVRSVQEAAPSDVTTELASPAASAPTPTSAQQSAIKHNINAGQVGGSCDTTTDGKEIRAMQKSSCEFAAAIYDVAISQSYTSKIGASGNAAYRSPSFQVNRPVTGQSFTIACRVGSDGTGLLCEDPNDTSVGG